MTASSPSLNASDNTLPLPLPRLVLRLGGVGNRYFGEKNGIVGQPEKISGNVKVAIGAILDQIETALKSIHEEDHRFESYHWPDRLPASKKLARFLLRANDRWGIESMRSKALPVFSKQQPLISLCTGGAVGTDTILADLLSSRSSTGGVEYQTILITPEAPQDVPTGLGVGSIPDKLKDSPDQAAGHSSVMPRPEAEQRSIIARQRAFGFRAQSEALRHHSDIMVAVWDPHAEGKAGGTSESVAAALNERIPVIAVRILGDDLCDIKVLASPEDLRVLNGLAKKDVVEENDAAKVNDWQSVLSNVLKETLKFPDPDPHGDRHGHQHMTCYHPRAAFHVFCEGQPLRQIWTNRLWLLYESFAKYRAACHTLKEAKHQQITGQKMVKTLDSLEEERRKTKAALTSTVKEQCKFWKKAPAVLSQKTESELIPSTYDGWYHRVRERAASDGMSGVFGNAHRGGILASYVLAAFAVMLAVIGGLLHYTGAPASLQVAAAVFELIAIVLMFAIAQAASLEDWNTAYTESRILAEALRMMEYLGPLGVHTPLPKLPHYLIADPATTGPDRMWSVWYFRALVRMAPLRLESSSQLDLQKHRTILEEKLVKSQRDYHLRKSHQHLAIHHDIESASLWLFVLVFLCVALHILEISAGTHFLAAIALIICVGAPALIAALHGLASQIEISRLRQRSSSVATLLDRQYNSIRNLELATSPDSAEKVWTYTTEVLSTTSLLMDETAGWSMLYRNSDIHAG